LITTEYHYICKEFLSPDDHTGNELRYPSQTQSLITPETLALPNILNTITVLSIFGFTSDIEHITPILVLCHDNHRFVNVK